MKHDPHDLDRARELRQEMNEVEATLWHHLRDRRLREFKFRRQQPLGPFVADFWCATARLVVELDGESHRERKELDAVRDQWMKEQKMEVLRFKNRQVHEDLAGVLDEIEAMCQLRTNSPSP